MLDHLVHKVTRIRLIKFVVVDLILIPKLVTLVLLFELLLEFFPHLLVIQLHHVDVPELFFVVGPGNKVVVRWFSGDLSAGFHN